MVSLIVAVVVVLLLDVNCIDMLYVVLYCQGIVLYCFVSDLFQFDSSPMRGRII